MIPPEQLIPVYETRFGSLQQAEYYFSPGRVNLIGEHIDYNGGYVMPAAISLGVTAVFQPDEQHQLKIYSKDFDEEITVNLETLASQEGTYQWPLYVIGTLKKVRDRQLPLRGGKIVMASDLPPGAGLSSSAALECLIAYIMAPEYYDRERTHLALDAQRAEREEIGMQCGIMDQYAVAYGKKDQALLLDCSALEHEYLPADFKDFQLVIINTNHPRTLADSRYNERRAECERALAILNRFDPAEHLANAHEISVGYLEDDTLYFRAKHVVTEQQRVLAAFDALKLGRLDYFGDLLWASHQSLDEDYEVAGDALNCIVHYAGKFKGCIGARMTGAGFGGCAIALVEKASVKRFCDYVGRKYETGMGRKADFYMADISDGVHRLKG